MTPENLIKNQICSWLSGQNCLFFIHDSVGIYDPRRGKFLSNKNPYRIRGVSDILGIWQGRFMAIEVKSKTGTLSDYQKFFIEWVKAHGGIAFVARSIEDVKQQLKQGEL